MMDGIIILWGYGRENKYLALLEELSLQDQAAKQKFLSTQIKKYKLL